LWLPVEDTGARKKEEKKEKPAIKLQINFYSIYCTFIMTIHVRKLFIICK
jgi:hypothetical protein